MLEPKSTGAVSATVKSSEFRRENDGLAPSNGRPEIETRTKPAQCSNRIEIDGGTATVWLERKDGSIWGCLIDAEDVPLIQAVGRWRAQWDKESQTFYAFGYSRPHKRQIGMHRLILDCPKGMVVDHIDYNGINNTRSNIRIVTPAENQRRARTKRVPKTSAFRGVNFDGRLKKWRAQIRVDYRVVYLGMFQSEREAALAYDDAARTHHKDFAVLNFPQLQQLPSFQPSILSGWLSGPPQAHGTGSGLEGAR